MFTNMVGRPLTQKEQVDLRFLQLLFPPSKPREGLGQFALDNELNYVPLRDAPLAADGNLYPPNSKLAPVKDGDIIEEFVDVPPYVIGNPNYPGHTWLWELPT